MKVTAILKGMIDSNGHQPIQIRIADGSKRTFKPTGIKVSPDLFKDGRIDKKHPKAKEWKQQLEVKIIQYQAQAVDGFTKRIPKTNQFDFIQAKIKHLTRQDATLTQYNTQINKLKEFQPVIFLSEINHAFLNRYKAWLADRGNQQNTVWNAFKFLRHFVRRAYEDKLIKDYPFKGYEFPKRKDGNRTYLTEDELKKFDAQVRKMKDIPKLYEAGVWFLIACDTGLRISDVVRFDRHKHIQGNRLVYITQKTEEVVGQPIDAYLKSLFERVKYKGLSMHRNTYNDVIKIIGDAAGIKKHISTHTARHTAAMALANKGVSQEVAAKYLGHKDIRATAIYYKITNKRMDEELKKRRK